MAELNVTEVVETSLGFSEIVPDNNSGYNWLFENKCKEDKLSDEDIQKIITETMYKNSERLKNYNGPPEGIIDFLNKEISDLLNSKNIQKERK